LFIALCCNSCPCAGYVSIHRRARPCGAVPRHVDVSRPQKLLLTPVQCLGVSALKPAPATACPFAVVRVHAPPCAPMRLNSRPYGSMRAHASFSGTRSSSFQFQLTTAVSYNRYTSALMETGVQVPAKPETAPDVPGAVTL